jgi:hypothetical protein
VTDDGKMYQEAPYPEVLAELVDQLRYRDSWTFRLTAIDRGQGSRGLTLIITARVQDSYHRDRTIAVDHYMLVPPAAYDVRSWRRWLFEQCQLVDRHEAMELFQIGEDHPYAPSHGPGNDPYMIREVGTDEDRRTAFTGEVLDH